MPKVIEVGPYDSVLFRFGRASAPLGLPSEDTLKRPALYRFDDPNRRARVLYAAEAPLTCLLEYLAHLRPSAEVLAELEKMPGDEPFPCAGHVPLALLRERRMATFYLQSQQPTQRFLDLREPETREYLRRELASTLVKLKVGDLDASDALGRNRALTQAIAGWALDQGFSGIIYLSRYDPRLTNWALFEPIHIQPADIKEVAPTDPDLVAAMERFGLRLTT